MPLQEVFAGALTDGSVESDDLQVLSFQTFARAANACCAVVSTKELMQVPARLGNPDCIKVAVDATFKDIFGDWKLMPLGVPSKHLAVSTLDQGIHGKCWCTHCTPVLYCVTNSDGAEAKLAAAMAVEPDCGKLEQLWRQAGILQGDTLPIQLCRCCDGRAAVHVLADHVL